MTDSILDTVKKVLGIESDYTAFDEDIILHINSVFSTLQQLGVGPVNGFEITNKEQVWASFLGSNVTYNNVKTYVCLRVKLIFDPPATSFAIDSMRKQVEELEWRINVRREEVDHPWVEPTPPEPIEPW